MATLALMHMLYFLTSSLVFAEGKDRGVRLGKERAWELRTILNSDDTDEWKGKSVRIFAEKRFAFGNNHSILHFQAALDSSKQA